MFFSSDRLVSGESAPEQNGADSEDDRYLKTDTLQIYRVGQRQMIEDGILPKYHSLPLLALAHLWIFLSCSDRAFSILQITFVS